MTVARMVARLAAPLPLGETACTRGAQVAAEAWLEETACCGVRSEPHTLALARARCAEPSDGLDGS
jgi:hypothetical protein